MSNLCNFDIKYLFAIRVGSNKNIYGNSGLKLLMATFAIMLCAYMANAQPLSGNFTINKLQAPSASNFTSFQSIFNTLATRGVNGSVNIEVQNGPYNEQVLISPIPGTNAVNTVTLNGNNNILTYTSTLVAEKHTIRVDGADFITIKNLIVQAAGTAQAWGIHYTNSADYNTLENCIVSIPNFTGIGDGIGIVVSASNTNALVAGSAAKYLLITTCTVLGDSMAGPGHGIVINPQASGNVSANITVVHTQIQDFRSTGLLITNARAVKVQNCQISRPKRKTVDDTYGIRLVNSVKEDTLLANRVFNCYNSVPASSKFGRFYGIAIDNTLGNIVVANNLVYGNENSGLWYGIYMGCSPSTKVVHNTISADDVSATFGTVYGFYHDKATCATSTGSEFRNNIVSISRGGAELRYGVYQNSGAITINNNNVYVTGAKANYGWAANDFKTLADWRTATGPGAPYGLFSESVNPEYVNLSSGNLFPRAVNIDDLGYAAGIAYDVANQLRSNTLPDPGAYEFTINANVSKITTTVVSPCMNTSDSVRVLITNNSGVAISDFEVAYSVNGAVEVVEPFIGTIQPSDSAWYAFKTLIFYPNAGNYLLRARIKGKANFGPKTIVVNPIPFGFKIQASKNFKGNYKGGDFLDPDVLPTVDTSKYEITPPLGYTNFGYGINWHIDNIKFSPVNSLKTINAADTGLKETNNTDNSVFSFRPSANLVPDTFLMSFTVSDLNTGCFSPAVSRYVRIAPKPAAAFTFTNVCEGKPLQFVNLSTGASLTGYKWYFGDNDSSTATSPLKLYNTHGSYKVVLRVTSPDGFEDSSIANVRVFDAPETDFTFTNQCEGKPIDFTNNSVAHTSLYTQEWNFGDGVGTSTVANPVYQYNLPAVYTVKLTITDARGCATTASKQVTFAQKPVAGFSVPALACNQTKVPFTNNTIGSGQIGYTWFFGDGDSSNAKHIDHQYAREGQFVVKLIARNSFNCTDTISRSITLLGTPDVDFATNNSCANEAVEFTNNTIEPINTPVSYFWDFGDIGDADTANTKNGSYLYSSIGERTITLVAKAANGCNNILTRKIDFTQKPLADFIGPQQVCVNEGYKLFNNTVLNQGLPSYRWNLGGRIYNDINPIDTFRQAGNYTLELIAYSSLGCSDTVVKQIEVINVPSSDFEIKSRQTGDGGLIITPKFPNGDGSYLWLYGNGQTDTLKTQHQYVYSSVGLVAITLRIENKGCTSTTSKTTYINPLSVYTGAEGKKLSVYPNPSAGSFFIALPADAQNQQIVVYNTLGEEVFAQKLSTTAQGILPISLSLPSGNYKILVNSQNSVYSAEITIVN